MRAHRALQTLWSHAEYFLIAVGNFKNLTQFWLRGPSAPQRLVSLVRIGERCMEPPVMVGARESVQCDLWDVPEFNLAGSCGAGLSEKEKVMDFIRGAVVEPPCVAALVKGIGIRQAEPPRMAAVRNAIQWHL